MSKSLLNWEYDLDDEDLEEVFEAINESVNIGYKKGYYSSYRKKELQKYFKRISESDEMKNEDFRKGYLSAISNFTAVFGYVAEGVKAKVKKGELI